LETTAMTSSWQSADNKKVKKVAEILDNRYVVIVEAYT
jgi:hypothetical protein